MHWTAAKKTSMSRIDVIDEERHSLLTDTFGRFEGIPIPYLITGIRNPGSETIKKDSGYLFGNVSLRTGVGDGGSRFKV